MTTNCTDYWPFSVLNRHKNHSCVHTNLRNLCNLRLINIFTKSILLLFSRRNKALNQDFSQSKPPLSPKETPTFLSPKSESL